LHARTTEACRQVDPGGASRNRKGANRLHPRRNNGDTAMSWSDPIVDEVRRARDAYAARFNYDLRAIFRDLKEQEKLSGRKIVSYAKDSEGAEPSQLPLPAAPAPAVSVTIAPSPPLNSGS